MAEADIELGYQVVRDGLLAQLRAKLGFPRMLMAEMLYTTIPVYEAWETRPTTKIRKTSAERIGQFYASAIRQLEELEADDIQLKDLVPWHMVAAHHHIGQEVLYQRYRKGDIDALDLGILGLWGYKEDLQ